MQKTRNKYKAGDKVGCFELLEKDNRPSLWKVRCTICSSEHVRSPAQLKQELRKGCKNCTKGTTTHGKSSKDPTYISWSSMLQRVRGTSDPDAILNYAHVSLDERWKDFSCFLEDMGERPEGTSLDRIDSFKGYHKDNCRWADDKTQQRNRQDTIVLTFDGVTKSLADWAEEWGLEYRLVLERYRRQGDTTKERLNRPPAKRRKHDS